MHKAQRVSTPRNLHWTSDGGKNDEGRVAWLPLYSKSLELAEGGVLAGRRTVFGDQGSNVHAQVTEGCVEEEAVDGLVEASA